MNSFYFNFLSSTWKKEITEIEEKKEGKELTKREKSSTQTVNVFWGLTVSMSVVAVYTNTAFLCTTKHTYRLKRTQWCNHYLQNQTKHTHTHFIHLECLTHPNACVSPNRWKKLQKRWGQSSSMESLHFLDEHTTTTSSLLSQVVRVSRLSWATVTAFHIVYLLTLYEDEYSCLQNQLAEIAHCKNRYLGR